MDPATGQHYKNLFQFIKREHCMLDTLHLLLRCVDRLVHTMVILYLDVACPTEKNPDKQLLFVNKHLAQYVAKITKKARASFQPPGERGSLWKLSHQSGTIYRLLLDQFKYADVLPHGSDAVAALHQATWDGFRGIYKCINSPEKKLTTTRIQATIEKWFTSIASDYVAYLKREAPAAAAAPDRDLGSESKAQVPDVNPEPAFVASKATLPQLKGWLTSRGLMPATKDRPRLKKDWVALVEAQQAAAAESTESDDDDDVDTANTPLYLASYMFTPYNFPQPPGSHLRYAVTRRPPHLRRPEL